MHAGRAREKADGDALSVVGGEGAGGPGARRSGRVKGILVVVVDTEVEDLFVLRTDAAGGILCEDVETMVSAHAERGVFSCLLSFATGASVIGVVEGSADVVGGCVVSDGILSVCPLADVEQAKDFEVGDFASRVVDEVFADDTTARDGAQEQGDGFAATGVAEIHAVAKVASGRMA